MSTFSTSECQKGRKTVNFLHFWLGHVLHATTDGVHFFDIWTSKSGPNPSVFGTFDLEMCFAPQTRSLFQHLNFQKWSGAGVLCTFWIGNVIRATTATLHTLHSALYTLHFKLSALHSALCTFHFPIHTLHSTLYTWHPTLYTPHFTLYTLHFTLYTLHFTIHTLHFPFHILHSTLNTLHFRLHTLHSTLYT